MPNTLPAYRLGASEHEKRRLLAQCDLFRDRAAHMLDRIPVPPQARLVDIGCGPLGILDLLSARGDVIGLDNNPVMLGWAAEAVQELGLPRVRLHRAQAQATGLPRAAFDLVHARKVLVNTTQPAEVLAEMVALTKPGGWVALQEVDWGSWTCQPPHPAWNELQEGLAGVFGGDVHIGRQLPTMMESAGLTNVTVEGHVMFWKRGDLYQTLLLHFARLFDGRLRDAGVPAERLRHLVGELEQHLSEQDTWVRDSTLTQAWGQRAPEHPAAM